MVTERGLSVRETQSLVRKALRPELTVVSEVPRTQTMQVQQQQKASGAGRIVVEFKDQGTRDQVIEAIKSVT
jgi:hypothetical protein